MGLSKGNTASNYETDTAAPPYKGQDSNEAGMGTISIRYFDSPCGRLILGGYEGRLCLCDWAENPKRERTDARIKRCLKAEYRIQPSDVTTLAAKELEEYFSGGRTTFDTPLLPVGTVFQKEVWKCLSTIPYGRVISYSEEARLIGQPSSVRAVANANGANSLSIFIPCHRVIGSDGSLTGYAGGTEAKRYLLELEDYIHNP